MKSANFDASPPITCGAPFHLSADIIDEWFPELKSNCSHQAAAVLGPVLSNVLPTVKACVLEELMTGFPFMFSDQKG